MNNHLPIADARALLARRLHEEARAREQYREDPTALLDAVCARGAAYYGLIESLIEGGWTDASAIAEAKRLAE